MTNPEYTSQIPEGYVYLPKFKILAAKTPLQLDEDVKKAAD